MSAVCAFNCLVNAFAALMRANKSETVSIMLIFTVCSSHLYTCVYTYCHGSSAARGSAIIRVYIGVGIESGLFIHTLRCRGNHAKLHFITGV